MTTAIQDFIAAHVNANTFNVTLYRADGHVLDIGEFAADADQLAELIEGWAVESGYASALSIDAVSKPEGFHDYTTTLGTIVLNDSFEPIKRVPFPNEYAMAKDETANVVATALKEGLIVSIRDRDNFERAYSHPGTDPGDPGYRDIASTMTDDSNEFLVSAQSELGVLFLNMVKAGEL